MTNRLAWAARIALLVAAGAVLTSCAAKSVSFDSHDPRLMTAHLEYAGPSSFSLRYAAAADLKVRYVYEDGSPIPNAPIAFTVDGAGAGAHVSANTSDTGSDGVATVHLTAGSSNTTFQVTATPPQGDGLPFTLSVLDSDAGSIAVDMQYTGTQTFADFVPYLFHGVACDGLDPTALPTADRMGAPVTDIRARPAFTGLPIGSDYTVAVVAHAGGHVAGFGCTVGVAVQRGMETRATVTILDVEQPVRFEGVYDLNNTFDFAGALPPSVDTALHVLDELTDDQNIDGDAATNQWGQDPGAFVVDYIMRLTCHWECMSGEDYSSCSEVNHPIGDLRDLYTHDFTSWSGAQARFTGGCAAWEVGARSAQNLVNMEIGTYVPEVVQRFLDAAGDLARAIDQATITSKLTLTPGAGGMTMRHELQTMQVQLRDLGGTRHYYVFNLADVGLTSLMATGPATAVGDELQIPMHSYELDLGKLLQYIYIHGLLPLFGFTSTADMLASWIDCPTVATELQSSVGVLSESQYLDACNSGLALAGRTVDENIAGVVHADTRLTLEGTTTGTDITTDGIAQTLSDGVWAGTWGESASSANVSGTFMGELSP